jgi:8-oxo-dGTP pyrophosphatase MutT (NUDIX family)
VKRYVLGFAIDLNNRVALIKKQRPDWQRHRWNGIGGSIEMKTVAGGGMRSEVPIEAMQREFAEETGVMIPGYLWREVGVMFRSGSWHVTIFTVKYESVANVRTQTDEEVRRFFVNGVIGRKLDTIENVPTILQACIALPGEPDQRLPYLTLDYT